MKIDEIKQDRRNYRQHNDKNKELMRKSLQECGTGRSIVVDSQNEIIAGNGIFEEAKKLKIPIKVIESDGKQLIVIKRSDLKTKDKKRKKLAVYDNSSSDLSIFNLDLLEKDFSKEVLLSLGIDVPEINTPTFDERLKFIKKMSKVVKRLVVRCQPYIIDYHKEIRENIKKYAQAGVYGVIFEAIKFQKSNKNLVQIGADFCYPNEILKNKFLDLKEECHKYGLKFLSGENRFRNMGDSLSCCGFEGLEGFEGNKYNLNYKIYKQEDLKVTKCMKKKGSAYCFKAMHQKAGSHKLWKSLTYKQVMDSVFCNKSCVHSYLGIENGKRKKLKTN